MVMFNIIEHGTNLYKFVCLIYFLVVKQTIKAVVVQGRGRPYRKRGMGDELGDGGGKWK